MATAQQTKNTQQRKRSNKAKKNQMSSQRTSRRNVWLLVITTILVIFSVFMFMPPQDKINQGLDVQGGLSVVLTAKTTDGSEITSDDMESSRAIIENHVNALGASEAVVQEQGTDQILVQIPGMTNTEEALETIGKTGQLEFARLDSFTDESVVEAIESGEYASESTITDNFGNVFPSAETQHLTVEPGTYTPIVTGKNITSVNIGRRSDASADYEVELTLDSEGTEAFAEATTALVGTHGQIVIILDGEVQSAPSVQSEILTGDVSITGNYTLEEAQSLMTVLQSGSLPVSFEYAQSQVIGPTLGQDALFVGVMVMLIGLAVVMVYLLFFYRGLGIITVAAMLIFAVLYLGILATLSYFGLFSLSLAGIAGIVLTIGMAADSSILTLERFREEIRMGRTVRAASITGVRHAIMTSIDADLVTMVSALVLFFLASASVRGFGLTLALGIICDIAMMLLFKAPLIRLLAPGIIARHPGFWGIRDVEDIAREREEALAPTAGTSSAAENESKTKAKGKTNSTTDTQSQADVVEEPSVAAPAAPARKSGGKFIRHDINFLGHRRVFLTVSAVLVIAALVIMGVRGFNFGIEFVGGTSATFTNTGSVTTEQMRTAFDEAGEPDAVIQTTDTNGVPGFLVRTTTTSSEEAAACANEVAEQLGISTENIEVTTIGPDWGASVIQSSVIAFIVSLLLIIVYIAIRFEYKMGLCAIVALLHDLIIVIGIYALVGREVNPNTIAALLTILGYSLYDTVVVFHRINDNMKSSDVKCTFMSMANHSINQVLIRTINTTLTSLIPVLAMLIFGGETLKDFAFAMTIGLICGSYSSFAVATPLFAMWKTHEPRYKKLVRRYGSQVQCFDFGSSNVSSTAVRSKKSEEAPAASATAATTKVTSAKVSNTGGENVEASSGAQSGGSNSSPGVSGSQPKAKSTGANQRPKGASASKNNKKQPQGKRIKRPDKGNKKQQ